MGEQDDFRWSRKRLLEDIFELENLLHQAAQNPGDEETQLAREVLSQQLAERKELLEAFDREERDPPAGRSVRR